jgi:hypothetical protein
MKISAKQAPSPKTGKKETTFYRLVEHDPGAMKDSYVEDVERWNSDNYQYLIVEEEPICDSETPEPLPPVPF